MSDKKNEKPVVIETKKPVAEAAPAKALPAPEAAPKAQKLPDAIIRKGVAKIGGSCAVVCGDITLPFKIPSWPLLASTNEGMVNVTVGQPSKKWLGQNGGVQLKMAVYRSEKGSVVVMSHADGVIVHAYPDTRQSSITVECL